MLVEELKNTKEWEDFLKVTPGGTFYHSLKWKEVIQKSFPHSAFYLTIRDANGRLVGICPGFIVSSMHMKIYHSTPYSDYGGPVIAEHCIEQASLSLRSFLQSFCSNQGIAYAKIRFMDDKLVRSFKSPLSYVDTSTGIVEIDLKATPSDFIWNKIFSARARKRVRLIERDGFKAQEARSKSDLRDFYNLYYKNMKYIGASPYQYEFMENMWSILYPENLRIWIVGAGKRTGGIAVFKYGRRTYWVYVGIDRKKCSSRYSVVPYLLWKEVKKAEEEGYRYVSLGATPSDPKNPHNLQKMGFGGSFYQQKTVFIPFDFYAFAILLLGSKAIRSWKAMRNILPTKLQQTIESRLRGIF